MMVSVMDYLVSLVMWFGDIVIAAVNAAWSVFNFDAFDGCLLWFGRLNEFMPVNEFFQLLSLFFGLAAIALVIKFGIKCVDWLRG